MYTHWTRGGEGEDQKREKEKKNKAHSESWTKRTPHAFVVRSDRDWGLQRPNKKKGCPRNEARLLTDPVGADVPYSSRVS